MNTKTKRVLYRLLKIIWIFIGISIAIITSLIYSKMNSPTGLGIIVWVILFTIGIYSFFFYVGVTLLFLLIKWVVKKIRKKKIKSHEDKLISLRVGGRGHQKRK